MAAGEIRQGHQLRSLHAPRGGGDHGPTARAARVRDRRRKFVDNTDRGNKPDHADGDPRPAAVTFVTTEHFTLQGARSSTITSITLPSWPATYSTPRNGCPPRDWGSACGSDS